LGTRDRYHVTGTIDGLGFRTTLLRHKGFWQISLGPKSRGVPPARKLGATWSQFLPESRDRLTGRFARK